jgi:hypothetical protein
MISRGLGSCCGELRTADAVMQVREGAKVVLATLSRVHLSLRGS